MVNPINNQQRLVGMEEIPLMVKSQEYEYLYNIDTFKENEYLRIDFVCS